jgi:hypothetical protein
LSYGFEHLEGLSIAFGVESGRLVHDHSTDGVFGHGFRFLHGHAPFLVVVTVFPGSWGCYFLIPNFHVVVPFGVLSCTRVDRLMIALGGGVAPHCGQVSPLTSARDEPGHPKPVGAVFLTELIQHPALLASHQQGIRENDDGEKRAYTPTPEEDLPRRR